jgi:hydroxymethylglutaryl-CoA lyase
MTELQIVEVGLRDGFQSLSQTVPTQQKIALLHDLAAAGVRRVEVTSFVSQQALPQMADAAEVLAAAMAIHGLDPHVRVPTARHAERAFAAGAKHIAFFLSVSEWHNQSNVRRTPLESVAEFGRIATLMPAGTRVRMNLATSFDCPREGRIESERVLQLLERLLPLHPTMEVAFCDTTGKANPAQVKLLFGLGRARFPQVQSWAFHGHDTYGLGAANSLAAWQAGAQAIDSSFAGLGGCPFAPGATGNAATEDILWMFEQMEVATGIDLEAMVEIAGRVAGIPGAQVGGRVRAALQARAQLREVGVATGRSKA